VIDLRLARERTVLPTCLLFFLPIGGDGALKIACAELYSLLQSVWRLARVAWRARRRSQQQLDLVVARAARVATKSACAADDFAATLSA
jgi:alkylation response protein AidB-like acyl-CoA dehydrogenase